MTDQQLHAAILRAVASTRVERDIPAAVLASIRETHVVIERGRWERVRNYADTARFVIAEKSPWSPLTNVALTEADCSLQPGDIEPT